MRISDSMLFDSNARSLRQNQFAFNKAVEIASAGKRVLRPSDDPIASSRILKYDQSIAQITQHIKNMKEADEFLKASGSAFKDDGPLRVGIRRAEELAVQMANAGSQSVDRRDAAREIGQIFESIVSVANSSFRGQRLFAGNKIATAPFDLNKNWQGQTVGTTIPEPMKIAADDPDNPDDVSNDQLNITVDGVTVQVTLAANEYDGDALADEITTKVNEALQASNAVPKPEVTVQFERDAPGSEKGHLVITSEAIKGRSSVVFNKVVQPPSEPNSSARPPLGDARLALGLVEGKSQLSGGEYLGDSSEMAILIEPGVTLAKNLPGDRVFKGGPNGVDIFASLVSFKAALETGNILGIQTAITDMAKATDQVGNEQALIGARGNRLDATIERLTDFQFAATESKSQEEGSDADSIIKALSALTQQQTALQASLLVQARILQQPTLLSFLR